MLSPPPLDARVETSLRLLRTLLEEARGLLQAAPQGDRIAMLARTIERLQQEAERLAPDFDAGNLRNGVWGG